MLWTTPYVGDTRRFYLTLEPIYQYYRAEGIPGARRDVHRGLVNVALHDQWQPREFFFQVLYGRADNIDDNVDETETVLRAQWRQWYGREKTAFSTVGFSYRDNEFDSALDRSGDQSRDLEFFGTLITELDAHGRWRWFGQFMFNRREVAIFLDRFNPSTNRVYDFFRFESRFTYEAVTDVDLSLGVDHAVADTHDLDSIGIVAKASILNFGPFRAEAGARNTWYTS